MQIGVSPHVSPVPAQRSAAQPVRASPELGTFQSRQPTPRPLTPHDRLMPTRTWLMLTKGDCFTTPRKRSESRSTLGPNSFVAHFGYLSAASGLTTVPVGATNRLWPDPADGGQPTVFDPGRANDVFDVPFDGTPLVWSLGTFTATASTNDEECAPPSFAAHLPRCNCPLLRVHDDGACRASLPVAPPETTRLPNGGRPWGAGVGV
jgi:hypothetical protein